MHQPAEYATFTLYLPGKHQITEKNVTSIIAPRKIHAVDNLKAKMLIEMHIIIQEKINLILSTSSAYIQSQQIEIPLKIHTRSGHSVFQPVHAK